MSRAPDPVGAILSAHGIRGPWSVLPAIGIANRIYATRDVVLRVAGDHADSVADARTESIAAPAARTAGIRVPRLIAFDDSRELIDRPYSLWERVHAETLSTWAPSPDSAARTWRELGAELARLHDRVRTCDDPHGWLDDASRPPAGELDARGDARLERWLDELRPALSEPVPERLVHNDAHAGNVLCTREGALAALIDWGDAGFGDPAIELASVPIEAVPFVVSGYEDEGGRFGGDAEARILFDQVAMAIESIGRGDGPEALARLSAFLRGASGRWRRIRP